MTPCALLINLESSYLEFSDPLTSTREVLLMGLQWPTEYWPRLAISWIEQGAPIDQEVKTALDAVAENKHFPQDLRHKAFTIARRWERENA
jgi:hypothetical protein